MVSLALLDKVLEIDQASSTVKVQAGARVQEVVEELRPYGLTLKNFASIREQSIGGFTQVCFFFIVRALPASREFSRDKSGHTKLRWDPQETS